jgi:hypothetical protein
MQFTKTNEPIRRGGCNAQALFYRFHPELDQVVPDVRMLKASIIAATRQIGLKNALGLMRGK